MLSALKNFGITFLISAFLFAIIAYFAVGFVTNTVTDILDEEKNDLEQIMQSAENESGGEQNPDSLAEADLPVPAGNSFSFLILTTDYRPDLYGDYHPTMETMNAVDWNNVEPEKTIGCLSSDYRESELTSLVLVRADKERRQYVYSYFSPDMRVYTSTGYRSMAEVYRIYGKQTVADHLTAMTGLKIKYTFLLNGYNFDDLTELLGEVTVHNKRALYTDANGVTTQMETLVERIGDDGYPWTEHIPNTFLTPEGEVTADAETMFNLLSIDEHSMTDRDAKASEAIELVQKYLSELVKLDRAQLKVILSQLITREEGWINIEGYVPPVVPEEEKTDEAAEDAEKPDEDSENPKNEGEAEKPEEAEAPAEEIESEQPESEEPADPDRPDVNEDVPFDTTPFTEDGTEEEKEKEEEKEEPKLWIVPMAEPETPILETDFTMNDFDSLYELLLAVNSFDNVKVDYPVTYKEAGADTPAYFDPDLKAGLELYRKYRQVSQAGAN